VKLSDKSTLDVSLKKKTWKLRSDEATSSRHHSHKLTGFLPVYEAASFASGVSNSLPAADTRNLLYLQIREVGVQRHLVVRPLRLFGNSSVNTVLFI